MSDYYLNYFTIFVFVLVGLGLFGAMIGVARVLQPRRQTAVKLATYECGVEAEGDWWTQQHVRYYVFALLFVIFDIEAAFIFPWATVMGTVADAWAVLVEMAIFVGILVAALAYAIRKGLLRWM